MTDKYVSSDGDLPDVFWEGEAPKREKTENDLAKEVKVQVHFPAIIDKSKKQLKREARAIKKDEADRERGDKRTFVKFAKKSQMYQWLIALEQIIPVMDRGEMIFCSKLLFKFRKYGVERSKWISRAQYDWLKFIAKRYLWT